MKREPKRADRARVDRARSATDGLQEIRQARPMVSSLKIAELFERRHDNVLAAIRKEFSNEIRSLELKEAVYTDKNGDSRPLFWLNEEQSLFVMPFIGGKKAREGQRKLVRAYLHYRDHFANPPRADILKAKRAANRPLTDALVEMLADAGKDPKPHHFSNEARLCNWIITGSFAAIDEKSLSNEDAALLEQVRDRDRAFLLAGLDYETRKHRLSSFAIRARTKLLSSTEPGSAA